MFHDVISDQFNLPPLIIVAGPTASGKSDTAVALARRLNGSIISADSMQVYRGMDVGSAKVTPDEMQGIPHYLIDVIDPKGEWNVVRFQQEAKAAIADIYAKGRLPILCGGTGFYIQALLYDIDFTQTCENTTYRDELKNRADTEGPEALYAQLQKVDPTSAACWHPNNVKRTIRALEFYHETGQRISEHNEEQHQRSAAYDVLFYVLTMDRDRLYKRIDQRVDLMMKRGLVEEVTRLRSQGLTQADVSMQGLGYRQILDALDGTCTIEEAVTRIKTETRHFAKRQLTWFKREPGVIWMPAEAYPSRDAMVDVMLEQITEHYNSRGMNQWKQ